MTLPEQLAVRSQAGKCQFAFLLRVDEHQVRSNMTVPIAVPFAAQRMVPQAFRELVIVRKKHDDGQEGLVERRVGLLLALVVALELRGPLDRTQ